jgi:VWFA-related protein
MGRALVLVLLLAECLAAQETTFKSGISIVEIDASVFDQAGIVKGLTKDDFAVTDQGRTINLRYCVQERTSLDLLMLFDLSQMMAAKGMELRGAAESALAALREGDRVGVLTFRDTVQMELPLTADLATAKQRVRTGLAYATFARKPWVLSAVARAGEYLTSTGKPHGRRAILVFSANVGFTLPDPSHIGVASGLWTADAILSGITLPTSWTRHIYDENPYHILALMQMSSINRFDSVDDIAAQTGGEIVYTENAGAVPQTPNPYLALQQLIERMRQRYRLYYDMPEAKPGQRRRVSIELSPAAQKAHPDARIVGRRGYVVPRPDAKFKGG